MHKKIRLRKKIIIFRKRQRVNIILLIIVLLIFSLIWTFKFMNKRVSPVILNYAELEVRKLTTLIINSAINDNIAKKVDSEKLFLISKNSIGEISAIDFNPGIVNSILTETTSIIQERLQEIERGDTSNVEKLSTDYLSENKKLRKGIIFEIPSGLVFNNAFFSNIGPTIPVKLSLMGDIISEISTKVTNYGINNALIEVRVNINLTEQVILPLTSNKIEIKNSIPIAIKLIQGTVPSYYLNGINSSSNPTTIPVE